MPTRNDLIGQSQLTTMDLFDGSKQNGELGNKTKLGALACFVLACALLVASLIMPQSAQVAGDPRTTTTGSVGQGR